MSQKNQPTTAYRFISKSKTAFKIHIHTPEDTILSRSIGYIKMGEEEGLKKAIKVRNELGKELWGKHWSRILNDPTVMLRLPHSLEPKIVHKPSPTKDNPDNRDTCYIAKWREVDENGNYKYKTVVRSINKYGKLAAYSQTKRALLDAHKENLEILTYMGRLSSIDLK